MQKEIKNKWIAICDKKGCGYLSEETFRSAGEAFDHGTTYHLVDNVHHTIDAGILRDNGKIKRIEWDLLNTRLGERATDDYV